MYSDITASLGGAYPRMRGGTIKVAGFAPPSIGLSPHARGNRLPKVSACRAWGPIPACAGEP